ncbi:hypothetical protein E3N88_42127 [Mikania micrantha]|uniref:Uncharacterized protein n=1 Tax=Mikania micrantha TaxID=192012 RepID=A0A5N6LIS7_9ASTR|nr:hypothetical protein E3N88_42127 [Mikania micrantha]
MRRMTSSQVTRGGGVTGWYQSHSDGRPRGKIHISAVSLCGEPAAPRTPSAPRPVTPPPPAPAHAPAPMPSPPRAQHGMDLGGWRGQARKTTGLPPRHQMAQRDEPQAVHEVGESSHQAELRAQVQQISQDLQALRHDVSQHHTLLEDTRTTAWRATMEEREERLQRTWVQRLVVIPFWQQVAVWSAGVERVREFVVWLGMASFETRMLVVGVFRAAVAMLFSCLSYFYDKYDEAVSFGIICTDG